MFVSAVQPVRYSLQYPPPFFPKAFDFAPFDKVFETFPVATWLTNSAVLSGLTTLLYLALTIPGAFTLSAMRWRGRGSLFYSTCSCSGTSSPDSRRALSRGRGFL